MGGGKSSGSQNTTTTVQMPEEQKALLGAQTKFLTNTAFPAYQETIGGAKNVYGRTAPAAETGPLAPAAPAAEAPAAPAAPAAEAPAAPAPVKAETTPIEVVAEPEPEAPAAETKSRNSGMADESARYGESLLREMLGAEPMQDKNGK